MRTIALLTTGGTIEKTYDEETGILSNRGSQVEMMLKRLRLPGLQIQRLDLMGKDSLEMDDRDRSIILKAVELYLLQDLPVVCLHGTDTMENTEQYLYDHLKDISIPLVKVLVPNSRFALAMLANQFYGYPSRSMKLLGITGTNGKTTTTQIVESIFMQKYRIGLIGTFYYKIQGQIKKSKDTTPGPPDLQEIFQRMVQQNRLAV